MSRRLFDTNQESGITRFFHWDDDKDDFLIETVQDCEPITEAAKAQFNEVTPTTRWGDGLHKVATIPLSIYMDLVKKGIAYDDAAMKKWLNDPDNRAFRTRPGVV
jgi:hypothetical protein